MTTFRQILAASAVVGVVSAAAPSMAATYAFTPTPLTQGVTSSAATTDFNTGATSASFVDDFEFTLSNTEKTSLTATFFNDGDPAPNDVVTSASIQIFEGVPGASIAVSPLVSAGDPLSIRTRATLNPGVDYYLEVTSVIPGGDQSQYGVTATVSAVSAAPEPGVWALMLAGVATIGLALRSRRENRLALA